MPLTEPLLPVPRTWAHLDKATAALLNANLRDPVTFRLTPPLFKLSTGATTTSVPTSTFTAITWGSADADTYGGWSNANPTRYTAPVTGWYYIVTAVQLSAGTVGGRRVASIWVNGGTNPVRQQEWQPVGTFGAIVPSANFVFLNKGDYFEAKAWQNSGATLTAGGTGPPPSYTVGTWIHP